MKYLLINETGSILAPGRGPMNAVEAIAFLESREKGRLGRVAHGHPSTSERVNLVRVETAGAFLSNVEAIDELKASIAPAAKESAHV